MKNLIQSLIAAQKEIKHAQKDAKNPHFKNHYATLESVIDATKNILLKNNIVVVQLVQKDNVLVTKLIHESGEELSTEMNLIGATNMQQMGSALTYARRYSLAALLNIAQTDDDANEASNVNEQQTQKVDPVKATEGFKAEQKVANVEDYIMPVGNTKVKGKKLRDINKDDLKSTLDYFKSKGELTGAVKIAVHNAEIYLKTIKTIEPKLDESEELPF